VEGLKVWASFLVDILKSLTELFKATTELIKGIGVLVILLILVKKMGKRKTTQAGRLSETPKSRKH
jgi:hypothetical protein